MQVLVPGEDRHQEVVGDLLAAGQDQPPEVGAAVSQGLSSITWS